jgi:hypothetical protein
MRSQGVFAMSDETRFGLSPALEAARTRRIRLHTELVDLERALAAPTPGRVKEWTFDVAERLGAVREAFDEHVFVTEKPEGLYEEIMTISPRLAGKIKRLDEEHPVVLAEIDEMLERLDELDTQDVWPPDVARDDINKLLGRIVRHRQRGADLVWEAYNVDIGGTE